MRPPPPPSLRVLSYGTQTDEYWVGFLFRFLIREVAYKTVTFSEPALGHRVASIALQLADANLPFHHSSLRYRGVIGEELTCV